MTSIRTSLSLAAIALGLAACATEGGMKDALAYGKLNSVMDATDKQNCVDAIRANETKTWTAANGNHYTFTPTRTFTGDQGTCRDYRIDANIGGNTERVVGTACTGPRSFWQPTPVK